MPMVVGSRPFVERFASKDAAILFWAAHLNSVSSKLEDRIHSIASFKDIDIADAAFLLCEELNERTDDELLYFVEGH